MNSDSTSASVVYELGRNLYINLTNRCPCACEFCVRNGADGLGTADSLWLDSEPTAAETIAELSARNLTNYVEIVFCGYGEPTCALDVMLDVARWLKSQGSRVRLNTNGLSDLINATSTAPLLEGLIDVVSVSLNAPDAKSYNRLCNPEFGEASFRALLQFASECRQYVPEVQLTVVDALSGSDLEKCREVAERVGVPLRIRELL